MKHLITIVYRGRKVETVLVQGSIDSCENKAFEHADKLLGLETETDKSLVELYFHDDARASVLFEDIKIYKTDSDKVS